MDRYPACFPESQDAIPGWKDSQEQIYACEKRITEIKADQERRRLEKERQDELARIAKEQRIQKTKK